MRRNARFRRKPQDPALMHAMSAHNPLFARLAEDAGFGNAINVSYVVPQYEAAGVSAVVMEDKTFPKDSSLCADGC